jgi:hypothetical protein
MALPTTEELLELMVAKASAPKSSASGDKSITQHDLGSFVEAAKLVRDLLASETAGALGSRGLRFTKLIPPGGGGD